VEPQKKKSIGEGVEVDAKKGVAGTVLRKGSNKKKGQRGSLSKNEKGKNGCNEKGRSIRKGGSASATKGKI